MKKPMEQILLENRRLVILRLLAEAQGRRHNSSVLHMSLHHLGLRCERHEVIEMLRWLQLHQLIDVEQVLSDVYVATLRGRGADVAAGHLVIDGVTPPSRY